ncbi:MAG TPA: oxidoreductase, partial [Mycobacterium sp.]
MSSDDVDPGDLLAPLSRLPGVTQAGEEAREALGRAHRHRANLRGWPKTAAEASLRAARASSVLDGGPLQFSSGDDDGTGRDPVLAGALRVAEALEGGEGPLVGVWRRAPL